MGNLIKWTGKLALRRVLYLMLLPLFLFYSSQSFSNENKIKLPEGVGPDFTKIATILKASRIESGELVYWDQAAADVLGIKNPIGSAKELEEWAINTFGYEILEKVDSNEVTSNYDALGNPYFFVEMDDKGGAGRAGYVKVGDTWVNQKGIGQTGVGNARTILEKDGLINYEVISTVGPPLDHYVSHNDGSATLREAIKEAVYGRVSDIETKRGASRVIAIIKTNRVIERDGIEEPLALIIRAPVVRHGQLIGGSDFITTFSGELGADSLAHANIMRLLKGDLVNNSNLGVGGEMVDFGVMTHTGVYGSFHSHFEDQFLFSEGYEFAYSIKKRTDHYLGIHLLGQMGVPEEWALETIGSNPETTPYELVARNFKAMLAIDPLYSEAIELHYKPVPIERLDLHRTLHEVLADLAYDFFKDPTQSKEAFYKKGVEKFSATGVNSRFQTVFQNFCDELHPIFKKLATERNIDETVATKMRRIAWFRNRPLYGLIHPNLYNELNGVVNGLKGDPRAIQKYIDTKILTHRLGTNGFYDNGVAYVPAKTGGVDIFLRVSESDGGLRFSSAPSRTFPKDGSFNLSISTDRWKTHRDLVGEYVENRLGKFIRYHVEVDELASSQDLTRLMPYVYLPNGERVLPLENIHMKAPPWMINEAMGLPESFVEEPNRMQTMWQRPMTFMAQDMYSPAARRSREEIFIQSFDFFKARSTLSPNFFRHMKAMVIDTILSPNSSREMLEKVAREILDNPKVISTIYLHLKLLDRLWLELGMKWESELFVSMLDLLMKQKYYIRLAGKFSKLLDVPEFYRHKKAGAFLEYIIKTKLIRDRDWQEWYFRAFKVKSTQFPNRVQSYFRAGNFWDDEVMVKIVNMLYDNDKMERSYVISILLSEGVFDHPQGIAFWEKCTDNTDSLLIKRLIQDHEETLSENRVGRRFLFKLKGKPSDSCQQIISWFLY